MTNEIINLNSNSAQPGINQTDVKSLPILVPDLEIMNKFNNIVSPMKHLTDITNYQEMVDNIKSLFVSEEDNEGEIEEIQYPVYTPDNFLEEV